MKSKHLELLAISPIMLFGLMGASENTSEPPVQETTIVETVEEEKSVKEEIEQFKDTYLIPIFSTVFGTVSIGTLISVFFAIKNRKTNKLMKEENDKIIAFALDFYKTANEIVKQAEEVRALYEENAKVFEEKVSALIKEVEEVKTATDKVASVKKVLVTLGEIQTEIMKAQPSAVTSGVSKSLNMLQEQIKSLE